MIFLFKAMVVSKGREGHCIRMQFSSDSEMQTEKDDNSKNNNLFSTFPNYSFYMDMCISKTS